MRRRVNSIEREGRRVDFDGFPQSICCVGICVFFSTGFEVDGE